jgi:hypothetical protein
VNQLARKAVQVGARLVPRIVKRIADRRAAKGGKLVLWWRRNFGEIPEQDMQQMARKYVEEIERKRQK